MNPNPSSTSSNWAVLGALLLVAALGVYAMNIGGSGASSYRFEQSTGAVIAPTSAALSIPSAPYSGQVTVKYIITSGSGDTAWTIRPSIDGKPTITLSNPTTNSATGELTVKVPDSISEGMHTLQLEFYRGSTFVTSATTTFKKPFGAVDNIKVAAVPSSASRPYPNNDDFDLNSGFPCKGRLGNWHGGIASGRFVDVEEKILCHSGAFFSPGNTWGGEAYSVEDCVQKGAYYSKDGKWVRGSKKDAGSGC